VEFKGNNENNGIYLPSITDISENTENTSFLPIYQNEKMRQFEDGQSIVIERNIIENDKIRVHYEVPPVKQNY
jgi:hypothetical protein